jgi:hypothetical protein
MTTPHTTTMTTLHTPAMITLTPATTTQALPTPPTTLIISTLQMKHVLLLMIWHLDSWSKAQMTLCLTHSLIIMN